MVLKILKSCFEKVWKMVFENVWEPWFVITYQNKTTFSADFL